MTPLPSQSPSWHYSPCPLPPWGPPVLHGGSLPPSTAGRCWWPCPGSRAGRRYPFYHLQFSFYLHFCLKYISSLYCQVTVADEHEFKNTRNHSSSLSEDCWIPAWFGGNIWLAWDSVISSPAWKDFHRFFIPLVFLPFLSFILVFFSSLLVFFCLSGNLAFFPGLRLGNVAYN